MRILQPAGWPRPKGYANGIEATGRLVIVGGQIGWDETETFQSDDFVEQVRQTLKNTLAVLAEAADAQGVGVLARQERVVEGRLRAHKRLQQSRLIDDLGS